MWPFLRAAERFKTVTRSGWTSEGERESVAEHTWRLCLMAMLLYGGAPEVDLARLLRMCLVHDLGEALGGDVPAPEQRAAAPKAGQERADLLRLTAPLPPTLRDEIVELWDEYEAAVTPEARLAKGLDKLETILQHTQGKNPADFDYASISRTAAGTRRRSAAGGAAGAARRGDRTPGTGSPGSGLIRPTKEELAAAAGRSSCPT